MIVLPAAGSSGDWVAVSASGYPARPLISPVVPAAHLERRDQEQYPEYHGVGADQPDEGEYAHSGENREEHPEEHREYSAEDERPFAPYLLAQPYGRSYLREPGEDGPGSHQIEQRERGEPGVDEGDNAGQDANYSFEEQEPARRSAPGTTEYAHYREHAIDQEVRSEQQDQGLQRDVRAQKRGQAEEYGDNPPQRQCPPVTGLRRKRSLWLGHEIPLWLDRLDTPPHEAGRRKDKGMPISSQQIHYMRGQPTLKRQRADTCVTGGHGTDRCRAWATS